MKEQTALRIEQKQSQQMERDGSLYMGILFFILQDIWLMKQRWSNEILCIRLGEAVLCAGRSHTDVTQVFLSHQFTEES